MFKPMPNDPTRMIQERLEIVREEQRLKYMKNAAKGKKGMASRYQGNSPAIAQLDHNYNHSDSDSDSEKDLHPSTEPEKAKPLKPVTLPTSVELEVNVWLDSIAPLTGARDRRTMANPKRWREAVEKAMKEGHQLTDFMAVVKAEAQRNKSTPQFFTPEQSLKVLQLGQIKANNGFIH